MVEHTYVILYIQQINLWYVCSVHILCNMFNCLLYSIHINIIKTLLTCFILSTMYTCSSRIWNIAHNAPASSSCEKNINTSKKSPQPLRAILIPTQQFLWLRNKWVPPTHMSRKRSGTESWQWNYWHRWTSNWLLLLFGKQQMVNQKLFRKWTLHGKSASITTDPNTVSN